MPQQKKIVFDHYGIQQGFNSRVCRTVVKTTDGMVWITTGNGLARYDSKTFRFFNHNAADSNSIASNFTDQMVADKYNRLWIVAEAGLDMFDPVTEKFKHCYIIDEGKKKKEFSPESLYYDAENNRLWAGTWMGLYYADAGSNQFVKATMVLPPGEVLSNIFIDIKPDGKGNLWLCNSDGFYHYNITTRQITVYHVPEQDNNVPNDDGAFCLFPENDETIWIGTWSKGLVLYNIKTKTGKHNYYSDFNKEQNGVTYITHTGLPAEKDILWVSTPNTGLAAFNKKTGTFDFYYAAQENDKNGIKAITNRLLPTTTEGMWVASENGLHRYDYAKQLFGELDFTALNPVFKKAFPLSLLCIPRSSNGTDSSYWFNIPYVGKYVYNSNTNKLGNAPPQLLKYLQAEMYSSVIDADGIYRAGTDKYGLVGYDFIRDKMALSERKYFFNEWEWVTDIFEDTRKQLWLATTVGFYFLDKKVMKPESVEAVNNGLKQRSLSLNVQGVCEDGQGRIWITTGEFDKQKNAIAVYDKKTGKAVFFYEKQNGINGFPGGLQLANITSSGNKLFVATGSGLLKISNENNNPQYKLLTTENGISGNRINQVISDRQSRVWCSTEFGISVYLPGEDFFINYSFHDVNIGAQQMPEMFLSPNTGRIYICQQGALNYIDPEKISIEAVPRVQFISMQLFNKPFFNQDKNPGSGDVIKLRHNQNMISVEFTGMSFSNPDNNRYAWMLEGLEQEWNISKNNVASYTNLGPGTYRLLVKASNSSGVWTQTPSVITFIISPPFWKTWWFISLVVMVIATILYALYRSRIQQLLRMQKMRNTISRNLHDEIGSTLTSINILSNVSKQAMDKEPGQAKEMLQKIAEQSKTIQQNMSDIVWAIRSDNDKAENLLVRMREYAAETLEPMQIKTTISSGALPDKNVSPEIKKELLLIYKEAVNNIAKHAGSTLVEIRLLKNQNFLELEISDNGQWKGNGKTSGTGLGSMQQRAASLGGKTDIVQSVNGTTVRVQIPLT
jgi:ligand-binding sensor domain-containing protein/two-component sensor histidine kinase